MDVRHHVYLLLTKRHLRLGVQRAFNNHTWRAVSLAGIATSIIFVATNTCLSQQTCCHDKAHLLSRQKYVCVCVSVRTCPLCLSRQAYFCRDKKSVLSRQKLYLWQLPTMIGAAGAGTWTDLGWGQVFRPSTSCLLVTGVRRTVKGRVDAIA